MRGYQCPQNLPEEIRVPKSMLFSAKAILGQRFCLRHGFQLWHSCVSVLGVGQRQKREKPTGSDLVYGCMGSGFILLLCPHHYEDIHGIARGLIVHNAPGNVDRSFLLPICSPSASWHSACRKMSATTDMVWILISSLELAGFAVCFLSPSHLIPFNSLNSSLQRWHVWFLIQYLLTG